MRIGGNAPRAQPTASIGAQTAVVVRRMKTGPPGPVLRIQRFLRAALQPLLCCCLCACGLTV